MRVAILSPIVWRTPPRQYGPWELVASNIAETLVERGVDVTLFATGDSITRAKLAYCSDHPYAESPGSDAKVNECLHISGIMERAGEFDIIHNHYDFLPLTYSRLIATPMLTTIHGFSSPLIVPVYKKYNDSAHYVSISNANRHASLDYTATVYNGINTSEFTLNEHPGDYFIFLGRIHPEKGTLEAIQMARRCGKRLILAGPIQDEQYFQSKILAEIDNDRVVYAGNCGSRQRDQLLGQARALLHFILFDEPFGLSVAEAMCCGTPVIAFNRGSMSELILDGTTGFLVDTIEEAEQADRQLDHIERAACRKWALTMFSKERMTDEYIKIYRKIISE